MINGQLMLFIADSVERYIAPIAKILTNSKHILAIRDGFQLAMPFIFVGSLFIPLLYPPFLPDNTGHFAQSWLTVSHWLTPWLQPPFQLTSGMISLIISFGAAASLAKQYQLPQRLSGLTGSVAFLLLIGFFQDESSAFAYLGAMGIFTAVFASLYAVEIIHQFYQRGWMITLPEEVPEITRNGFALILPLAFILLSLTSFNILITHYYGLLFPQVMETIFRPLIVASDSLPAILFSLLICHLLFFIGIHGAILVTGIMNPFWLSNLAVNQQALANGMTPPHIYLQGFWDYYLLIGGVGSTIPLVLMAIRSHNQQLRSVGKLAALPAIFNINEPILFGFPIIMNPLFLLPFICVPMINATIAWYLTQWGVLDRFIAMLPWSMPAPLGAAWAANGSLNNALMTVLAMLIAWAIYHPFFKVHEKILQEQTLYIRSAS